MNPLIEHLRQAYVAFNAKQIDSVLALLHPDVDWPNALEGGRLHGHSAVREYWQHQFDAMSPQLEPTGFRELPDGRVAVDVHQTVRDSSGIKLGEAAVTHVYTFTNGLVTRMDVEEPAGEDAPKAM